MRLPTDYYKPGCGCSTLVLPALTALLLGPLLMEPGVQSVLAWWRART